MPQLRGKFITLVGILASDSDEIVQNIDQYLLQTCLLNHLELDPEEFYDVSVFNGVINIYTQMYPDPLEKIIYLGRRLYPTIKRTVGLPPHLNTPKDYVLFETEGFKMIHSDDVEARKIIEETDRSVTLYAPAPGYPESIFIGVWLGILEMIGVENGEVEPLGESIYRISW